MSSDESTSSDQQNPEFASIEQNEAEGSGPSTNGPESGTSPTLRSSVSDVLVGVVAFLIGAIACVVLLSTFRQAVGCWYHNLGSNARSDILGGIVFTSILAAVSALVSAMFAIIGTDRDKRRLGKAIAAVCFFLVGILVPIFIFFIVNLNAAGRWYDESICTTSPAPTETPLPSDTPTITLTPSDTPTSTETPIPSDTPTLTPTDTSIPLDTPTLTPTDTLIPSDTPTPPPTTTPTPSDTLIPMPTETLVCWLDREQLQVGIPITGTARFIVPPDVCNTSIAGEDTAEIDVEISLSRTMPITLTWVLMKHSDFYHPYPLQESDTARPTIKTRIQIQGPQKEGLYQFILVFVDDIGKQFLEENRASFRRNEIEGNLIEVDRIGIIIE